MSGLEMITHVVLGFVLGRIVANRFFPRAPIVVLKDAVLEARIPELKPGDVLVLRVTDAPPEALENVARLVGPILRDKGARCLVVDRNSSLTLCRIQDQLVATVVGADPECRVTFERPRSL